MQRNHFLVLVGIVIGFSLQFSSDVSGQHQPLQKVSNNATKIATTKDWYLKKEDVSEQVHFSSGYHWLSDTEILIFKHPIVPPPETITVYGKKVTKRPPPYGGTAYRLNVKTGTLTLLPAVTQKFKGRASEIKVSPDGQSILWSGYKKIYVLNLDGSRYLRVAGEGSFDWLDNANLLEVNYEGMNFTRLKGKIHPLKGRSSSRPFPRYIPDSKDVYRLGFMTSNKRLLHLEEPYQGAFTTRASVRENDLSKPAGRSRNYPIRFAPYTVLHQVSFSKDGSRIAWLLTTRQNKKLKPQHGLWISQINGKRMQCVFTFTNTPDTAVKANINWSPSGDRVSFVSKGNLYTVSVGKI